MEEAGQVDGARRLGQDEEAARGALADLIARGYVEELRVRGEARYRVRLAPARRRQVLLDL